ncbi:MAG: ABC transporter permease [Planctomycetota bacterium]|nr:ABC transporter permease [Planctomycetota bacterium]
MSTGAPLLEVRDLAVAVGGRELLGPSSFTFHEGDRVLIVGPSGSGKSLFVNLLLGFVGRDTPGVEIGGSARLQGTELLDLEPEARDARLGAVFQLNALGLFDDLTVAQNLRFGSADPAARAEVTRTLRLDHVDPRRPIPQCSGGEQMRIAIARTLLRGAGVLIYDEPTTGLDPAAKKQVVSAIADSHRRLTLVVTHDYAAFEGEADVVLFLDPEVRRAVRLDPSPASFERLRAALETAPTTGAGTRRPRLSWWQRLGVGWQRLAVGTVDTLVDALSLVLVPLAWLRAAHAIDGPRVRKALKRDLGPGVALFIAISAMLVSFTGTYFLFEQLPEREYAEPLIQDDLLAGMGLIYTRIGIPLMVSVLLAAKLGAAAAAQLGHMSFTRQVDALRLLCISPRRHLLWPTASGQLIAACLATVLAVALAYVTSMVVFLAMHPGWSARYFHESFVREVEWAHAGWLVAKVGVSALGVALVAFRTGTSPKYEPGQVVKGIHKTLLRALLLVLAVHAFFAFLEF